MTRLPRSLALAALLLVAGCQASVGERLYAADKAVSLAARAVTAYAKSGASIPATQKTALIDAGTTADRTLDAAHAAVDAANKAGVEPGTDANAMIDAATNFAVTVTRTVQTLKADAHAN